MIPLRREFFHASRAWYGDAILKDLKIVDEIEFGYPEGPDSQDGQTYEATMRWHHTNDGVVPALEIFNCAWLAFLEWAPLFRELAELHDKTLTPGDFSAMLRRHGFADTTPTERPSERRRRLKKSGQ